MNKKIYIVCEASKKQQISFLNDIWEVFSDKKLAKQRVNYLNKKYTDSNFWVEEKTIQKTSIWKTTLKEFITEPAK